MATDPYRYFRIEARELVDGLAQGVLALEKAPADSTILPQLFRLAHTLKGAARVVRKLDLAEFAHAFEELLSPARDQSRSPTRAEHTELLALVDRMNEGVQQLNAPAPAVPVPAVPAAPAIAAAPAPEAQSAPLEEAVQTVRIEIEEMDSVLRAVMETGVQLAALSREVERVKQLAFVAGALSNRFTLRAGTVDARNQSLATELQSGLESAAQGLETGAERVAQELADVREGVDRLRLVPVDALFPVLERALRDAAETLGRRAELVVTGGGLRLDAHVLGPLRAALLHLVRNAVAHGIETPAERVAASKPERGTVTLRVERRDDRVVFACSDDGRGIDVQAVRRELVRHGAAGATEIVSLSDDVVLERLLSGAGVSTVTSVTPIAGRGVGLDVVRETARRLSGDVSVRTTPGRGATIELRVPVSLAAVRALVVEAGGATAAIPLDAVTETMRLDAGAIGRTPEGDVVSHRAQILPFLPLRRALRQPGAFDRAAACSAVVVVANEQSAVIGVDRMLGTFDVVVRPLPRAVVADAVVAGATMDAEGNPRLVLDAVGLLAAATSRTATVEPLAPERLPILVIDDSLTTRMLEQSILESAGYAVETAVSAEQGLEKAHARSYGLFIVDVEMPGMNGFEFVTTTRADAELRHIPAILVSSRDAPEDLKKGEASGASAYVVKGEFDQNLLLSHIRRLVG